MKTLIKNVTILTMDDADRVLRDGWLLIDGEKIAALGEEEQKHEHHPVQRDRLRPHRSSVTPIHLPEANASAAHPMARRIEFDRRKT